MVEGGLPTGTITFLFTDVGGSTALWEDDPAAMRAAMAHHDRIIESAVTAAAGEIVRPRGEGDSRFAVFTRASDAVGAAIAITRDLEAEAWPTPRPIRVRIALHTGEADLRADDYYGPPVNRCARLRGIAHPGQLLVSDVTAHLVRDALPSGAALRDLGEHRLADVRSTERVYQLVHPALTTEFPPLRSTGLPRHNLPAAFTTFVGREEQVATVRSLLAAHRLVTLAGPGGTGKTRLAVEVARGLLDRYAGGAWLVDLAPVVHPDSVAQVVASVLGVREASGTSVVEALAAHLARRDVLLILDNCEHLVDAAAKLADTMVRAADQLRVLATSREPLAVDAEVLHRVPPLAVPGPGDDAARAAETEAVQLFVQRAELARPGFAFADHAAAVVEICRRLDGIPLAIELAAARVRAMGAEEIASRLDQRLRLLTGGGRSGVERHQTLAAALDWSHNLLTDAERVLFRRLAVFGGGAGLDTVEDVCSGGELDDFDIVQILTELVDRSLVVAEADVDGTRYRMLETIRELALAKLMESDEAAALHGRHLDAFMRFAEAGEHGLRGSDVVSWLRRFENEHDNLRAALRWAADEGQVEHGLRLAAATIDFWIMTGSLTEGRDACTALLQVAPSSASWGKATAYGALACLQRALGELDAARRAAAAGLAVAEELGDEEAIAELVAAVGIVELGAEDAVSCFEDARAVYVRLGNDERALAMLHNASECHFSRERYAQAAAGYEEVVARAGALGLPRMLAYSLGNLGVAQLELDRVDEAAASAERCVTLCRDVGDRFALVCALGALAEIVRRGGELKRATALYAEAVSEAEDAGHRPELAELLIGMSALALDLGDAAGAATLAGAADGIMRTSRGSFGRRVAAMRDGVMDRVRGSAAADFYPRGVSLSVDQAVAFARDWAESTTSDEFAREGPPPRSGSETNRRQ